MGSLDEAPTALFVYGTLRCAPVLQGLIRRTPCGVHDSAPGWRVARLADRVYPGLVPGGGAASGLVLTDLTPPEWRTLDDFEDAHYALHPLRLASGRHAVAYVWTALDEVLTTGWDLRHFEQQHLTAYIARFR
ncbi:gamma-glutamylcyclotransferase family protein [Streptomyces sp. RFCAC02]|uniref:gamma-glutamylcyclotransferase family protein n=1 Tax=Streptomyces sp. RFCAC02 TaxID=2499143 RepID=UPI001F0EC71C|nr:gamma-glutamylcyclotransferase family protein [Streptomyces sp. RFCAC02]